MKCLIVAADQFAKRARKARNNEGPKIDILSIAEELNADLINFEGFINKANHSEYPEFNQGDGSKSFIDLVKLAFRAYKIAHNYDVIFLSGEDAGIPFTLLNKIFGKKSSIVFIGHLVSVKKKTIFLKIISSLIDKLILHSPVQENELIRNNIIDPKKLNIIPFHADHEFYSPKLEKRFPKLIVSVGFEHRDFKSFFDAVKNTDWDVQTGIGSRWSRFRPEELNIPDNVVNKWRNNKELRFLYQNASAVVVPLVENDFQAGVSVALEAMACGAPVIMSATNGNKHILENKENGLYVIPENSDELRKSIKQLTEDESLRKKLSNNARKSIVDKMSTDLFVKRIQTILADTVKKHAMEGIEQ